MSNANPSAPANAIVLVTGGTGLVALHCIHQLLLAGYQVRTTVRSAPKESNVVSAIVDALQDADLTEKPLSAADAQELVKKLTFVHADLSKDEGWETAVKDAKFILHVASPFPAEEPKDEDELIKPAVEGTLRVLKAATVSRPERIVLTSSVAAISYSINTEPGKIYTEDDWTEDVPGLQAYRKSKVRAEKAAWEFVKENNLELAVVNPGAIFGPPLRPREASTTIDAVRQALQGKIPAAPPLEIQGVDVRDVASLHLLAMTSPKAAGQRYIAVASLPAAQITDLGGWLREDAGLKRDFGEKATAKAKIRELPIWLVKLLLPLVPQLKLVAADMGKNRTVSSEKAQKELGWKPRSNGDAVVATARALLKAKAV